MAFADVYHQRYELVDPGNIFLRDTGGVVVATDKETNQKVAIRYVPRGEQVTDEVVEHLLLLHGTRHPNIIRVREVFLTSTHLGIVTEYADRKQLFTASVCAGYLEEEEGRYFFRQLLAGLEECENKNLLRDLKLHNILLTDTKKPRVKLCCANVLALPLPPLPPAPAKGANQKAGPSSEPYIHPSLLPPLEDDPVEGPSGYPVRVLSEDAPVETPPEEGPSENPPKAPPQENSTEGASEAPMGAALADVGEGSQQGAPSEDAMSWELAEAPHSEHQSQDELDWEPLEVTHEEIPLEEEPLLKKETPVEEEPLLKKEPPLEEESLLKKETPLEEEPSGEALLEALSEDEGSQEPDDSEDNAADDYLDALEETFPAPGYYVQSQQQEQDDQAGGNGASGSQGASESTRPSEEVVFVTTCVLGLGDNIVESEVACIISGLISYDIMVDPTATTLLQVLHKHGWDGGQFIGPIQLGQLKTDLRSMLNMLESQAGCNQTTNKQPPRNTTGISVEKDSRSRGSQEPYSEDDAAEKGFRALKKAIPAPGLAQPQQQQQQEQAAKPPSTSGGTAAAQAGTSHAAAHARPKLDLAKVAEELGLNRAGGIGASDAAAQTGPKVESTRLEKALGLPHLEERAGLVKDDEYVATVQAGGNGGLHSSAAASQSTRPSDDVTFVITCVLDLGGNIMESEASSIITGLLSDDIMINPTATKLLQVMNKHGWNGGQFTGPIRLAELKNDLLDMLQPMAQSCPTTNKPPYEPTRFCVEKESPLRSPFAAQAQPRLPTPYHRDEYSAPEVLAGTGAYDQRAANVWAVGVMLFVMLTREYPFQNPERRLDIQATKANILAGRYTIPRYAKLSADCLDLLSKLFAVDPRDRITLAGIKEHPWFKNALPPEMAAKAVDENQQGGCWQSAEELRAILEQAKVAPLSPDPQAAPCKKMKTT